MSKLLSYAWYEADPESAEPFDEWVERIIGDATGERESVSEADARHQYSGPLSDYEVNRLLMLLTRANARTVAKGKPGFDVDALVREIEDARIATTGPGDAAALVHGSPVMMIAAALGKRE